MDELSHFSCKRLEKRKQIFIFAFAFKQMFILSLVLLSNLILLIMKHFFITVVLFVASISASGQGFNDFMHSQLHRDGGLRGLKVETDSKRIGTSMKKQNAPMRRAVAVEPEGTARRFLMVDTEQVYGFTDEEGYQLLYPRLRMQEIVFADDGKVYVPNMFLTSIFDPSWLEGELDEEGNIVIEAGQTVASIDDPMMPADYTVSLVDMATGSDPSSEPIILYFDETENAYYLDENAYLGLFSVYNMFGMPITQLYTYCIGVAYGDTAVLPEAVEYDYFYDEMTEGGSSGQKTDVSLIFDEEGTALSTSLLPAHPDALMMLEPQEDGSLTLYSTFVVDDDMIVSAVTEEPDGGYKTAAWVDYVYNAGDGSYKVAEGQLVGDLFVDPMNGSAGYNNLYSNISLVPKEPTGIGHVEAGSKAGIVATEYYDMSGRRISKAAKGISIVVKKYADGTREAVKTVK